MLSTSLFAGWRGRRVIVRHASRRCRLVAIPRASLSLNSLFISRAAHLRSCKFCLVAFHSLILKMSL